MYESARKRWLAIMLAVVMILTMVGIVPETAWASEDDIVILYTNDAHCGIEDNIGYSGLMLYKKQMEAQYEYVTLVDAGDAVQGAPIGTLSDGEYLVDIMNYIGYDFAIPGNHEFDYGMDRFLELAEMANSGYYSCNLIDLRTGENVLDPFKIITYGDIDIAYVSISTPESLTKSTPAYFQDDEGNYIYGFCEDEDGSALYAAVQSAVDSAIAEGADYVIGVGHLGEEGSTPRWTSDAVIANTSGIDVLIDGHSHEAVISKTVENKDGEEVILTQTGTKLENIGKMTIEADGDIVTELVSKVEAGDAAAATTMTTTTYEVVSGDSLAKIANKFFGDYNRWPEIYDLNKDKIKNPNLIYPKMILNISSAVLSVIVDEDGNAYDYETTVFINDIKEKYEASLTGVIGQSKYELTINNTETGTRAIRNAETNLGDFCADAFRLVLGTDIGLMNGGGIRGNLPSGDITYNDVLTVFPYGNMICAVEITGQQLKDALEMASMYYPEEGGGFLQVSGMTYTINPDVQSSVVTDEKGNFVSVSGEYRVTDIKVGGEALVTDKLYTVASHDYMLKLGGDGMTMFSGSHVVLDNVLSDSDVLAKYVNENLGGIIGDEYKDANGTGRIIIK